MEKSTLFIFALICCLLLLTGAVTPGWIVMEIEENDSNAKSSFHFGLFYGVLKINDGPVIVAQMSDQGSNEVPVPSMIEFQIEIVLGLVLQFLSLVVIGCLREDRSPSLLLVPIIFLLFAALSTLAGVGRLLSSILFLAVNSPDGLHMLVSYSMILSGLGAIFCLILMCLTIKMYKQQKRRIQESVVM